MLEPLFEPFLISSLVPAASTFADDIDHLWELIFWITNSWFVLVAGVFFWLCFKFKKKDGVKAEYITGELKSEKKWVSYPHYAVLLFDIMILLFAVKVWYDVKQDAPPAQNEVRVISQQWAWTFQHGGPDGKLDTADDITKVNEMYVQKGVTYHYKLESKDVLHNFSVPVFRLKQDSIPGRVITGWFEATETGEYSIQCAEICGVGHGLMGARIFIQDEAEYAAWLQENAPSTTTIAQVAANSSAKE